MFTIKLDHICYKFENSSENILNNITLDIGHQEKIALIGPNGKGKTTLLKILTGELKYQSGHILFPLTQPRLGYLPQNLILKDNLSVLETCKSDEYIHTEQLLKETETLMITDHSEQTMKRYCEIMDKWIALDGYIFRDKAEKVLNGMGIGSTKIDLEVKYLSGGEKTRLALAKTLLYEPDILILDEPTNHLDFEILDWLENYLIHYPKAVLFVSHDRTFIDRVAQKVVVIERDGLHVMKSNYTEYLRNQENEFNHQMNRYQDRQEKIRQLKEAANARRKWASSFQRETGAEGKSYKFEMLTNPAKQMMRQANSLEARIRVLEQTDPIDKPWIEKKRTINFSPKGNPSETVFTLKDICKSYGNTLVLKNMNMMILKGERLHIRGINGSGKTTLIKLIKGEILPESGEILRGSQIKAGFFDQELENLNPEMNILDFLKQFCDDETKIRTTMACLKIIRDQIFQPINTLSTGEKVKVSLCSLQLQDFNVMILDEPTNHLDIESRIALENALNNYPGTIIFVSHDRTFIRKLMTREFLLN